MTWIYLGNLTPDGQWRSFSAAYTATYLRLSFESSNFNRLLSSLWLRRVWQDEIFQVERAIKVYPKPEVLVIDLPPVPDPFQELNASYQILRDFPRRQWAIEPQLTVSLEVWV